MVRVSGIFLTCLSAVFACAGLFPYPGTSQATFRVTERGTSVWLAPSEGWEVLTRFETRDMSKIEKFLENKPPELDAARLYELMVNEPGTWMGFSIKLGRVQKIVFTKNTKVVLIDREGRRFESEGCFFSPDVMQTRVYDSRKMNIVVSKKTVQCHPKHGLLMMDVKFPAEAFRANDLVEFEIVGAIEDTTQLVDE